MRIAVWHNLPSGGGKRALWYHIKGLMARGHHIEVWAPPRDDLDYMSLSSHCEEHLVPLDYFPAKKPKKGLLRQAVWHARDYEAQYRALHDHCRACAAEINHKSFDVLFANSSTLGAVSPMGLYSSIPSILYLQEPNRPLYESAPRLPWGALPRPLKGRWWSPVYLKALLEDLILLQSYRAAVRDERNHAAAYRRLLVNSQYSRESVLRAYGLECRVCRLGIDAELFSTTKSDNRQPFVVGLGVACPHKGVDRAIRAVAAVPADIRPELVWIANRGEEYVPHYSKIAKKLNVRLTFHFNVSDEKLVRMLHSASMMLYVSRLEPFGFAPLEAAACATPVVAIAEGGVRETVVDKVTGLLVPDESPEALANALLYLLQHPKYARKLGENGRSHVRDCWQWDRAVEELEENIRAIL